MRASTVLKRAYHVRNLLLVILSVVVGIVLPKFGLYTEPFVTPLVILLIFGSLREFAFREVAVFSYGGVLALSLLISYMILPFSGIRIASQFLSEDSLIGVAIILASPTTAGSAIIWTRLSDGDDRLSTVTSVTSLLVAPVVTPLVFYLLVGSQVDIPVRAMLLELLVIVGGGVALVLLVPREQISKRTVDRGAGLAILILIYSSVANLDLGSVSPTDFLLLVAVTLLLLGGCFLLSLLVGYAIELDHSTVIPLFFTSSFKNFGIALFISFSYSSPMTVAAIVTYYVVQQLVGAVIADVEPLKTQFQ